MRDTLEQYWNEIGGLTRQMPFGVLAQAADILLECHGRSGTVFAIGNGGSAATASHFVCDLAKGTRVEHLPAFRAVALTDNVPLLTAWANDTDFSRVFAEQLEALVRPGDVVVAISASGNSPNVLCAAAVAHDAGATTIAMTGQTGGQLIALADLTIQVPSPSIEQVEDAHLIIAHSLCVALRTALRSGALSILPTAGELVGVPAARALEVGGTLGAGRRIG